MKIILDVLPCEANKKSLFACSLLNRIMYCISAAPSTRGGRPKDYFGALVYYSKLGLGFYFEGV